MSTSPHHHRLVIIGSGSAGLSAAIYAARAGLKPLVISGDWEGGENPGAGGQLTTTFDVENYPGYSRGVWDALQSYHANLADAALKADRGTGRILEGRWLMREMTHQAEEAGAAVLRGYVKQVDFTTGPKRIDVADGPSLTADAVIVATGAQAMWLGLPSEGKFKGGGVSACATCDGTRFEGQRVLVVGGGNTAVEEALYLASLDGIKVTLVHRRDTLRAEQTLQNRLFAHPKVTVLFDHVVQEVLGVEHAQRAPEVTGVRLAHVVTGDETDLSLEGVFVAIGHKPASGFLKRKVRLNKNGYVWVRKGGTQTSVPGVFAAGDICDFVYRQAVTAAGMGCMAALDAQRYLASGGG
jgi:thioredoxin reductase (NADPH)